MITRSGLSGVRGERAASSGRVGRLRVVDVLDAADLAHELEAVLDSRKRAQRLGDRIICDSDRPGRRRGRRRVLAVVVAGDQRLGGKRIVEAKLLAPPLAGNLDLEASRHDGDIVRLLVFEDPDLRLDVAFERPVPVEVVGLDVQEHGDPRPELVHVLELEARQLAHDPRALLEQPVERGERAADVPCHDNVAARRAHDRPQQLAGGRLAVRPGHTDDRPAERPIAQLDLAPDGYSASTRLDHERVLTRNTRALDEQSNPVEEREIVVVLQLPIGLDDLHHPPLEQSRRGLTRPGHAEDKRPRRQDERQPRKNWK